MNIELNEPKTITLSPQAIVACINALNELPYKIARPAIDEIYAQLQSHPKPDEVSESSPS